MDAAGEMSGKSRALKARIRRLPPWAIALASCASLAIALAAANLVYAAQSGARFILEGAPGELLYVAAFSGFADEWDLYEGRQSATIIDEQLELRVSAAQTAAWSSARHRFRDFDLRVSLSAGEGPIDNAMGVVFHARALDDDACDLPAVILCGLEEWMPLAGAALRQIIAPAEAASHYAFLISSDGYYSLRRTAAGSTEILSAWIPSAHINQGLGAVNVVRVRASAGAYRFYVNGAPTPLCIANAEEAASTFVGGECVDGEMRAVYQGEPGASGKLGLIAQSTATGGPGVVVRFDNLLVFSPARGATEEVNL